MKNYRVYLATFAAAVLLTLSCKKDDATPTDDASVEKTAKDVSYGDNSAQKLDIYLPAGRTDSATKIMVLVHGGAWTSGDKTELDSAVLFLRPQLSDYAIFNINYRLAALPATNLWPAPVNDINSAIDYIISKGAEYHINTNKIVLIGASAGAHLSLLHAYNYNSKGNVKAVVDLFGPTDITALANSDIYYAQLLSVWLGGTPATAPANYVAASPIQHVTAQSPPTIIFHGTADDVVPISQSVALKAELDSKGVINDYKEYPGEKHGWTGSNLLDTYNRAIAFIKKNVQ
ncbi:Acetyl esterase/lipase [Filimonas lacunae]|uniref:Acetyl esterase/lipase n=1 Tax=Filimonas lacunae TaxID=477680 RepID=A0A173MMA0_9BACT|nr:alpha/beta hydrolase [Filimonas lacunae]BAV08775.1 lipase [Filimonas lacunae]SIS61545.1 Acetyl esterase/lipase [Filimonas lacunae]